MTNMGVLTREGVPTGESVTSGLYERFHSSLQSKTAWLCIVLMEPKIQVIAVTERGSIVSVRSAL